MAAMPRDSYVPPGSLPDLLTDITMVILGLTSGQRFGAEDHLIKPEHFVGKCIKQQYPTGLTGYYHIVQGL